VAEGTKSVWAQYSLLCMQRDKIMAALKEKGVPTAIYYPIPLHLQGAYRYLGYEKGAFPVAERVASAIFSLPMHPYLGAEDQQAIADAVLNVV